MAIIKPTKPSSELPNSWGGTQYPYTQEEITEGYLETVPQIVDGGKLNYEKKGVFERLSYLSEVAEIINNTPIEKMLVVDSNNRFEYRTPAVIATDEQFKEGVLETVAPSVKQAKELLPTITYWD